MTPNFKVVNEKIIYNGFLTLKVDELLKDDQSSLLYHVVLTKCDAVSIIAKTTHDRFLVTGEYRHPIKKSITGFPGGRVEKNEDLVEAAKRELKEETGYIAPDWSYLGSSYAMPAVCEQKIHFVLAEGAYKDSNTKLDPFEVITISELKMKDINKKIIEGFEFDGIFLSALNFYKIIKGI